MKMRLWAVTATLALFWTAGAGAQGERWVGTWGNAPNWRPVAPTTAAPPPAGAAAPAPPVQISNQTLRQVVHTSIKGDHLRVVFTNAFGTLPVWIGSAHVALRDKGPVTTDDSDRRLTFDGRTSVSIPPGAMIVSDPVSLAVPAMSDLAIDLFLPGDTASWNSPLTLHRGAYATTYVSETGNHTGEEPFPVAATTTSWWLLSRVEVTAAPAAKTLVTFGDSITDGTNSTIDANHRWPDVLSTRLQGNPATASVAIVNAAIAGNRLLTEASPNAGINALARFDRDVLAQPGVAYVTVLEGINDLGLGTPESRPGADDLIAAYKQLIDRAHAHGIKIYGATLTPFEGAAYFSADGEKKRVAVNQWIRTGKAFDAVIDFDQVTRDPAHPTRLLPKYDSGDHLHPNDAGYQAMGESVDLALFR